MIGYLASASFIVVVAEVIASQAVLPGGVLLLRPRWLADGNQVARLLLLGVQGGRLTFAAATLVLVREENAVASLVLAHHTGALARSAVDSWGLYAPIHCPTLCVLLGLRSRLELQLLSIFQGKEENYNWEIIDMRRIWLVI